MIASEFDHQHQQPPINRRYRRRIRQGCAWSDVLRSLNMPNWQMARAHRGGGRYVILCPFHDEKSASLVLFSDGGFHCHGCGKSGDVVDFVQAIKGFRTTRDIKTFFGPLMQPLSSA